MNGNVNERLEGGAADVVDADATRDSFKEPLHPGPRDDSTPAVMVGGGIRVPLKTPEKRHLPLDEEEGGAPEVRKRPLYSRLMSLSPPAEEEVEVKQQQQQRHVSKILFGSGSTSSGAFGKKLGGGGGVARCMFGGPTKEQNAAVMKACEEKIRQDYERFSKRWVVVDGEESPYEI